MIKHNYQDIEGWFNMEEQYLFLLDKTPENGFFVELGSYKGKSTSFIVTEMINRGRNINFVTVDTFQGDSGSKDINEVNAYKLVNISALYEEYVENTKHLKGYYKTIVNFSHIGSEYFADDSINCLFIDAGHSEEAVLKDIEYWLPKMKNGGIMAGHDYTSWPGVNKAVNKYFSTLDKVENDCWFKTIKK